jgi:hypothetical protein
MLMDDLVATRAFRDGSRLGAKPPRARAIESQAPTALRSVARSGLRISIWGAPSSHDLDDWRIGCLAGVAPAGGSCSDAWEGTCGAGSGRKREATTGHHASSNRPPIPSRTSRKSSFRRQSDQQWGLLVGCRALLNMNFLKMHQRIHYGSSR